MRKRKPTQRLHFTKRSIEGLALPEAGRVTVYDEQVRDLGLRVESGGRRSFFWLKKIRGVPTFRSIGTWPTTAIEQARGRAHELSGELDKLKRNDYQGKNVFDRRPGEPTLGVLVEDYIAKHIKQHTKRPERAEANARWLFDRYLAGWRGRKIGAIGRKDVRAVHSEIGRKHPTAANRAIQLLRTLYNFALREDWQGENPAKGVVFFHEDKRDRFVQPDEMPRLFAALREEPSADLRDFVCLALWTGARRGDIFSMRWGDMSLDDHRWNVPDPKAAPYTVALTAEAVAILKKRQNDSPWVFPSVGGTGHVVDLKARWKALLKRAGITNLRVHDLRRTHGSWLAGAGVSLPIIGKSLGHKSMAATQIYAQVDLSAVRAAVEAGTQAMILAAKHRPKLVKAPRG